MKKNILEDLFQKTKNSYIYLKGLNKSNDENLSVFFENIERLFLEVNEKNLNQLQIEINKLAKFIFDNEKII